MLQLDAVSKRYKDFSIRNVSINVKSGDYYVLLGSSGAGKSLILEIIAGLIKPDSGKIYLNNEDISRKKIQNRKIGLLFQDYAIFPHLSVEKNIAYALKNKGLSKEKRHRKIQQLGDTVQVMHLLHRKPMTLSGGELQRVAIARTLAMKPDLLLLDEPFSSLDVILKNDLQQILKKLNDSGLTIVHVTHNYEEALALGKHVGVMYGGEIIQEGEVEEVFQSPRNQFVANFTGLNNFFKANLQKQENSRSGIATISENIKISVLNKTSAQGNGFIVIRNNDVLIQLEKPASSAQNNFKGTVISCTPARFGIELVVDIGIQLTALITREAVESLQLKKQTSVWLSFKASAVRFIQ